MTRAAAPRAGADGEFWLAFAPSGAGPEVGVLMRKDAPQARLLWPCAALRWLSRSRPPPPSLPYKVDTSRPSLRTNWTRLVPLAGARSPRLSRSRPCPPQRGLGQDSPVAALTLRRRAAQVQTLLGLSRRELNERLWRAVRAGNLDELTAAALAGADVNANCSGNDGAMPPLHAAIVAENPRVAARLLALRASVKAHDGSSATALHHAAVVGDAETLAALIAAGAGVRDCASAGMTPLHLAAKVPRRLDPL